MSSLQIGAAVKHNTNNLQTMHDAGGFRRITQLMQWTAFTFLPEQYGRQDPNPAPVPSSPQTPSHQAPTASPKGGLKSLGLKGHRTTPVKGTHYFAAVQFMCM